MSSKKEIIRRLVIYIVLAFVLSNGPEFIIMGAGVEIHSPVYQMVALFTMFGPAVASILTRVITREGFRDMYLRVNLKGNVRYYILAVVLPVIYSILGGILSALVYGGFLQNEALKEMTPGFYSSYVGFMIAFAAALFFYCMGEELGWRGYMTPKLEELMGTPAALIVGGIIWGLWHMASIIYSNQGSGVGEILVQLLMKCITCIAIGSILTYLTKKTGSVYPASILHTIHNNVSMILYVPFITNEIAEDYSLGTSVLMMVSLGVIGVITFVLQIHDTKRDNGELAGRNSGCNA